MEREACVCDHGFERSDLCAEIIIISYYINWSMTTCQGSTRLELTTLRFTGPVLVDSPQ